MEPQGDTAKSFGVFALPVFYISTIVLFAHSDKGMFGLL